MKRNNPLKDCINLSYIELLKFKNFIKVTLTNPLTAIKSMITYLLPFAFMLLPILTGSSKKRVAVKAVSVNNFVFNIIVAILVVIILMIFLGRIYYSSGKYSPSQFTISDVNYLFSSPIQPRTIYAWTMLRNCIRSIGVIILFMIVYVIYGKMFAKLYPVNIAYTSVGLAFLTLFFKSFSFFIYSLSLKFNLESKIKKFVYAMIIVFAGYVILSIVQEKDAVKGIFQALNGTNMGYVPIIGWSRDILISPFFKNFNPLYKILAMVIAAVVVFFLAVYFATDYYEEASDVAEIVNERIKAVKENKIDEISINPEKERAKKKKLKEIKSRFEYSGPWSLIWKSYVVNSRTSSNTLYYVVTAVLLIISAVISYVSRNRKFNDIILIYLSATIGMVFGGVSTATPIRSERHKAYMFLIPGRGREKVLALHFWSFLKNFIINFVIVIPLFILVKHSNLIGCIVLLLTLCGTYVISLFGMLLVSLIMPGFDNGKNGFFAQLLDVMSLVPAIIAGIIAGVVAKDIIIGLLFYVVGLILTGIMYLILMDKIFNRLEMNE